MNDLNPTRVLITAGATQEPIDEVRYFGNRSSGKLGCLLALAAAESGHAVTLLHNTQSLTPTAHPRMRCIPFTTTRDLAAKADEHWPSHSILIMAAAVADFTPQGGQLQGKVKRSDELTIKCTSTDDIVASLAANKREDQRIIAFALGEQETLRAVALEKLERKNVDAIVANPLETMDSSLIDATVILRSGETRSPIHASTKASFARWLIDNLDDITCPTSLRP